MRRAAILILLSALAAAPAWADCDRHESEEDEEEAVAVESLPAPVREAIAARWPGSAILSAEREGGRYEVEIRAADGARREVEIGADGRIHEEEREDD